MKVLILGLGYCGSKWFEELSSNYKNMEVLGQSRSCQLATHKCDLEELSEYEMSEMLNSCDVWWLTSDVSKYSERAFDRMEKVLSRKPGVVLGTSSEFLENEDSLKKNLGEVSIHSRVNLKSTRTLRQNKLLKEGSCVLHLAGIWGENRDPLNWLKKDLISKDRLGVNLIHENDILKVLIGISNNFDDFKAQREILVDSQSYTWVNIISSGIKKGMLAAGFKRKSLSEAKKPRRNKTVKTSRDWQSKFEFSFHKYLK
jgi:hypothetical protein